MEGSVMAGWTVVPNGNTSAWKPVAKTTAPVDQPGFLENLGHSFGIGKKDVEDAQKERDTHPIRSLAEAALGPAYQTGKGLYGQFMQSTDEAGKAIDALRGSNPDEAGVHAVRAVPIVVPALDRMAEEAPPDRPGQSYMSRVWADATPGNVGTALGTAAQVAPMVLGGLDTAAPERPLVGQLPSASRAGKVFADIEQKAKDLPVYTDKTSPAVERFRNFVNTGGRNSRVMTKLSKRIDNLPPRPSPEPIPIDNPSRMLGAGTEDIPLEPSPAPRNPKMRPMAFDAKVNPEEPWEPRSGNGFAPISEYPGINPHYLSGSEHPELSGRVTPLQNPEQVTTRMGVLRRPKVFDASPQAEVGPQPDYASPLKFPEARKFYSNLTEASRRPGFLRRAIESPSAPKQRYQLGGVRDAMNSDLTNALPSDLSDQYTNALREYARAKTLGKITKGAALLGAGELARRTGLIGKIVHQGTLGQ